MAGLTPAQQLQFLALSPEQQEYFRRYNEKQYVQTQEEAAQEQQLALQLAQQAEAEMTFLQRWAYSKQRKSQMIAQRVQQGLAQFRQQTDANRQAQADLNAKADLEAEKQAQRAKIAPLLQAKQETEQADAEDAAQTTEMEKK
jgi:hypothetical protein